MFTGILVSKSLQWAVTWIPVYKPFKNLRTTNAQKKLVKDLKQNPGIFSELPGNLEHYTSCKR